MKKMNYKIKILVGALCLLPFTSYLLPMSADAANVTHRVARPGPLPANEFSIASTHPFYIMAGGVMSDWREGNNSASFEFAAGLRATDNVRLELNYQRMTADFNSFELSSNVFMMNAIMDGRVDRQFTWLRRQWLVPYIGIGAGLSDNSISGANATLEHDMAPVVAIMTGVSIEFSDSLALDIGYRYMYMFRTGVQIMGNDFDINPAAHQVRAALRLHF
ncbi:MAG: porin family protein [Alphaproteobacteria bacterium]|nr:porin family protein [Alphaproteobacteria bacterium]